MNYSEYARQIAAAFVVTMLQAGVFGTIVSQDTIGIYFSITLLIFGSVANQLEKLIMKTIANSVSLFQRPNVPSFGCGDFDSNSVDTTFGFPSGHAQAVGFALIFWYLYIRDQKGYYRAKNTQVCLALLILIAILICWSRVRLGCHNWIQIIVGLFIGMIMGNFSYKIYKNSFL